MAGPKILENVETLLDGNGEYKPRYMDATQIRTESNGKQFDKNGKPLVGRYRDGTTPKPNERAYGAGQIQIETARRTAQRHGIPFSESRLLNDRNYNLRLADTHMGDLLGKYGGDRTLARAAYHSGEGTVDRAIKKYGREGFAQGLGPHGRAYIQMDGKGKGTPQMAGNAGNYLDGLESTLAPEVAASQNVRSNASAIFGSDQRLNEQFDAAGQKLDRSAAAIDVLDAATQVANATQMEAKRKQIIETQATSDQIVEGTRQLMEATKPVFQARQRIADQMDRVTTMNPLERSIRGIFDLNYDQDYLEGQLDQFDRTLKARQDDYAYINNLHLVNLGETERRFGLATALTDLEVEHAKAGSAVAGMSLAATMGQLDLTRQEITTQGQVIAAKQAATEDMLGRLDTPTLNKLMGDAQNSGGVISYNGVQLEYATIRDRLQRNEARELSMESTRMAIASNRLDIAEKFKDQTITHMTREQLEAAIQNGGVVDGIQYDNLKLNQAYQSIVQAHDQMGQQAATLLPGTQALQTASQIVGRSVQHFERARQFYPKDDPNLTGMFTQQKILTQELIAAQRSGKPASVLTAMVAKIDALDKGIRSYTTDAITRAVGGDKRAAGYIESFVSGAPMDKDTAIEAVTYFALKGNIRGLEAASPESKSVFQLARRIVEENRNDDKGKPRSEAALRSIVMDRLPREAERTVGQARLDRYWNDLPAIAAKDGHAFGKLNPAMWRSVQETSTAFADRAIATQLNTTPEVIASMRLKGAPVDQSEESKKLFEGFMSPKIRGQHNAIEQQQVVRTLNTFEQLVPGQPNSAVLQDYLSSPKLAERGDQYSKTMGTVGVADYYLGPVAGGSLNRALGEVGTMFRAADEAVYGEQRHKARQISGIYADRPAIKMQVILSSIPALGPDGAAALMPFVNDTLSRSGVNAKAAVRQGITSTLPGMIGEVSGVLSSTSATRENEAVVLGALQSTKFEDPRLETYRKAAVAGWKDSETQAAGFFETLLNGLSGN